MSAQPWLKDSRWQGGRVRDSQRGDIALPWFAFLITAILVPFVVQSMHAIPQTPSAFLLIAPIALSALSLFFLAWTLYRTVRRLKYGISTLELITFPGVVGGQFIGIVRTSRKLTETPIRIRLTCIHEFLAGHGNTGSMETDVLWSDEILGSADQVGSAPSAIPVAFTIPAAARQTDQFELCNRIFWKLTITAKQMGVDFAASFEVPIYRTHDSAPPKT